MRNLISILLLIVSSASYALQIEGVNVPETKMIRSSKAELYLQGAGVRSKFIFDVYVGAFYADEKITSAARAVADSGPKSMHMYFLRDVSAKKMRSSWIEGIEKNNPRALVQKHQKNISRFISFFKKEMKSGDTVEIDYLTNGITQVRINNQKLGQISRKDFYDLVLNTWMGKRPPSKNFQRSLLSFNK